MSKRQPKFELLRIVAMLMIITLHYLSKGGVIIELNEDRSVSNHLWYLLDAFCLVSVNVYVLISGYFSLDSEWRIGKVIRLWITVLCYSLIVPLVLGAFGVIDLSELTLKYRQQLLAPVQYEHYWFATAYIMLYLISPVLTYAVKAMEEKQLRAVIIGLLLIFSGFKSINPYLIPWDKCGYDFAWFICLFLTAGYIKRYGLGIIDSLKKSVFLYVTAVVLTWIICAITAVIAAKTGKMSYYMDMTYTYNYVTVVAASIGLFGIFVNLPDASVSGRFADICNRLGGCTFGVYLLHENVLIRDKWMYMLGINSAYGKWWQIFHLLFCVTVVFVVGVIVDIFRSRIFDIVNPGKNSHKYGK